MKATTLLLSCLLVLLFISTCWCANSAETELTAPKLATIQLRVNPLSDSLSLCTGLVLSPNLILARANCLVILSQNFGFNPLLKESSVIVPPMIHSSLLSVQIELGKTRKVQHVELHDRFNLFTLESNLALLMLSTGSEEQVGNESSQQIIRRELQNVMQDLEKKRAEEFDANLILLSNREQLKSSDCLKDHVTQWRRTICKQVTYSGEADSLDDSILVFESKKELIPVGIQSFHESDQHEHKLYFTDIGVETREWFARIDKKLLLRGEILKETPFETYQFSPISNVVNDQRQSIMSDIQQRLAEIINQGPTPQLEKTPYASNTIYETENNLKEISKQLHSKLVNTILGL